MEDAKAKTAFTYVTRLFFAWGFVTAVIDPLGRDDWRFMGSALLIKVRAGILLAGAALVAACLCMVVATMTVLAPAIAALSIGLFNSIVFPAIFTLTLERTKATASATAGVLCVAIAGGAALPLLVGYIADRATLSAGFVLPLVAYLGVALFAFLALRRPALQAGLAPAALAH